MIPATATDATATDARATQATATPAQTPRRWVIDGQVLQTEARLRGMGQYALELLVALGARNDLAVTVVLTDALPDAAARASLAERAPDIEIAVLPLLLDDLAGASHRKRNLATWDTFLRTRTADGDPLGFLLLSPMQGTILPVMPSRVAGVIRWALVYDLIPLMFPELYLQHPVKQSEYERRLGNILVADGVLTISATVANDVVLGLGIDADRISSIDGAPIPHAVGRASVPGLRDAYVLMPTGNDVRKNNGRAVAAFREFAATDPDVQLVVTSDFTASQRAALAGDPADQVLFTGPVSGEQMNELYAGATAVLFPPVYEGLGLPVLEAVERRVPVACSDIPVFREITDGGVAWFDPESVPQMVQALRRVCGPDAQRPRLTEDQRGAVLRRFSWPEVAGRFVSCTSDLATALLPPDPTIPSTRLELVGPDPADDARAGRMLLDVVAEVSRQADTTVLVEAGGGDLVRRALGARELIRGTSPDDTRTQVHLLSSSPACALTLLHAMSVPGIAVVLDTDLSGPWRELEEVGLLSAGRIAGGELLHAQEPNGVHHLASVLATARWVVVFDEVRAGLLREACETFGVDQRKVICAPAPAPLLSHPELVRHERVAVEVRDELTTDARIATARIATATGRAAEATDRAGSRIARAAIARLDRAEPVTAARVLRLGVVPATTGSAAELGLPDDVVLPAAEIAAALRGPDRLDALAAAGSAQLPAHRPVVFAALLVELANTPTPTVEPGAGGVQDWPQDSMVRDPAAGRSGATDPGTDGGVTDAGATDAGATDAGTMDLTVVLESPQEGAPSVDRCGRMLVTELRELPAQVRLHPVQLRMPSVARSLPVIGRRHLALNLDRVVARYPVAIGQLLRADRVGDGTGFFHLADHVYAHLVGRLPAARTGVYCHDLDGFAPVLDPAERAHPLTRILARDALRGLAEAALVFHSTRTVGEQLTATGLIDPGRLVLAPLGAAAVFDVAADHAPDARRDSITGGHPYLLHVGSDIPRKRLDVLVETFARLLPTFPGLVLVQVGAATLPTSGASPRTNGLPTDAVLRPRDVDDALLASFYRGAQLVLVPSEAEGFGMPVVEALRCGSIVLASDLPVFREIAGDAILTAPVGDVEAFVATATTVLLDPSTAPSPAVRAAAAQPYTWRRHASSILDAYRRLHAG